MLTFFSCDMLNWLPKGVFEILYGTPKPKIIWALLIFGIYVSIKLKKYRINFLLASRIQNRNQFLFLLKSFMMLTIPTILICFRGDVFVTHYHHMVCKKLRIQ